MKYGGNDIVIKTYKNIRYTTHTLTQIEDKIMKRNPQVKLKEKEEKLKTEKKT